MSKFNLNTDFCKQCGCDGVLCNGCVKKKCYEQGKADGVLELVQRYDEKLKKLVAFETVDEFVTALRVLQTVVKEMKAELITTTCVSCILDGTDACARGAGRAVDDEICDKFLRGE